LEQSNHAASWKEAWHVFIVSEITSHFYFIPFPVTWWCPLSEVSWWPQ